LAEDQQGVVDLWSVGRMGLWVPVGKSASWGVGMSIPWFFLAEVIYPVATQMGLGVVSRGFREADGS
jgi:hypothetical protein